VTTEPLNPSVTPLFQGRYAENTAGIIAAITACIVAAGGTVTSYPSNTAGIIQALIDLQGALGGGSGGSGLSVRLPMNAGETLNACDAVYLAGDGFVYRARNTGSFQQANVLGFCREGVIAGASVTVIARGRVDGFTGLSTGQEYYLTTAGAVSPTPPIGGGVYLTRVGQALSAVSLDVQTETPLLLS
jgi:hypothetical protein